MRLDQSSQILKKPGPTFLKNPLEKCYFSNLNHNSLTYSTKKNPVPSNLSIRVPQKQNALHFSYFYWYSISGFLGRGNLSGFLQLPEVRHPTCLLKQCSIEFFLNERKQGTQRSQTYERSNLLRSILGCSSSR